MNQQDHNNEEQEVQHLQHEAEHAKPHKKVSVMGYLTILFAAAFLLLLLSYFMQQRANEQAISGLQATSNNAFDSINNLIAEKDRLTGEVEDLEGIVSIPRRIEGVDVAVAFRENPSGTYKISVRTGEKANASAICETFGGGGHIRAAGCNVPGPLEHAKELLLEAVRKELYGA